MTGLLRILFPLISRFATASPQGEAFEDNNPGAVLRDRSGVCFFVQYLLLIPYPIMLTST